MSEKKISRRKLLERGGAVGAGALAAGAVGGSARAAAGKVARDSAKPKKGGSLTWALEQDPGHIAPFGGILTMTWVAQQPMYESLLNWDKNLNIVPALATSYKVKDQKTIDMIAKAGQEPLYCSSAELGRRIARDYDTFGKLIRETGIKLE